jgi:hypothetical protein
MSETEIITGTEQLVPEPVKSPAAPRPCRRTVIAAGAVLLALGVGVGGVAVHHAGVQTGRADVAPITTEPVPAQYPDVDRKAAASAAAAGLPFVFSDVEGGRLCHSFIRMPDGQVFRLQLGQHPPAAGQALSHEQTRDACISPPDVDGDDQHTYGAPRGGN